MIPQGFNYSQSSLTTFARCRRQFLLRYVERLAWPAPLTDQLDEWEAAADRGRAFHQFLLQESLGMDVEDAVQRSRDPLLAAWWRNWREPAAGCARGGHVWGNHAFRAPSRSASRRQVRPRGTSRRWPRLDIRLEDRPQKARASHLCPKTGKRWSIALSWLRPARS